MVEDMLYTVFWKSYRQQYIKAAFSTRQGNRFYVFRTRAEPFEIIITGDTFGWRMTRLFCDIYDLHTKEEIYRLSGALKKLSM